MSTPQPDQHQSRDLGRHRLLLHPRTPAATHCLREAVAPAPGTLRSAPVALVARSVTAAAVLAVISGLRLRALHANLERARHDATHDHLTGLPTRQVAVARLTAAPRRAHPWWLSTFWHLKDAPGPSTHPDQVGMVGLLDLDDFKSVNDRHGHATGDRYLIAVAGRLAEALGQDGTVYRLSGDEFLLIWVSTPPDPLLAAGRVLAALGRTLTIDGHTFEPAASIGLAHPGPDLTGADLVSAADYAMYRAKQHHGRSTGTDSAAALYTSTSTSTDRRTSHRRRPAPENSVPAIGSSPDCFEPMTDSYVPGASLNHFETVREVIDVLAQYDPGSPVMSALQPSYPMTGTILGIVQTRNGVVWIATDTVEYLPREARDALGW